MPDNRDIRGGQDRQRVAAEQDYEIDVLRRKFGVTSTKVLEAIRAVGNNREDVECYLREQMGGYDPKRDVGPRE
jgi:hypothetical protein